MDDADWADLSANAQMNTFITTLGFLNEGAWEEYFEPYYFAELPAASRDAVQILGLGETSWDADEDFVSSEWSELPRDMKDAAETLGYGCYSWNEAQPSMTRRRELREGSGRWRGADVGPVVKVPPVDKVSPVDKDSKYPVVKFPVVAENQLHHESREVTVTVPPNDLCANAIPITLGTVVSGSTAGATTDTDTNPSTCTCGDAPITDPGVWYTFTGTGGTVGLETVVPYFFDTKLSLYSGSCDNLTCVAGNDDIQCCDPP